MREENAGRRGAAKRVGEGCLEKTGSRGARIERCKDRWQGDGAQREASKAGGCSKANRREQGAAAPNGLPLRSEQRATAAGPARRRRGHRGDVWATCGEGR